jgi:hypothetical protein
VAGKGPNGRFSKYLMPQSKPRLLMGKGAKVEIKELEKPFRVKV